jgi:competence protein ComEC
LDRVQPHWLLASLCCGIAAANGGRAGQASVAALSLALIGAGVVLAHPARVALLAFGLAGLGLWWGSVRLAALDRSALEPRIGEAGRASLVVTGPVRRTRFRLRAPVLVRRFGELETHEAALLELPVGRSPPQGAVIETTVTIERPSGPENGFDEGTWLRRHGAHVVLRGGEWRRTGRRGGLGGLADRIRAGLADRIAPGLGGERRAVVTGVVLGEDESLSEELRARFRASGLYHLLAVSGQNVALVAGGVLWVAWLLSISRWVGEICALAAIGGYVLAVGPQPSVIRAGVAGALTSLAWLTARERDRWWFLLLGALVLLAWNPYTLLDPGFQLSFAAVVAIFTLVPRLDHLLDGYPLPRPLRPVVSISTACGLATAPILWLHFGAIPLLTVPANALAAPAVVPLLGLGLATAAMQPLAPGLALTLAWLNGWCAAYLAGCARFVGGLPFAQLTSGMSLALVAAAATTAVAAAKLPRHSRRGLAPVLVLAILVLVGWRLWPARALPPPAGLRITFLDVGQGDSALLQVAEGAVLVDEGPPEAAVDDQLRGMGVHALSLLVLTHPQRDHVGGAAHVLERLSVGLVLDPRLPTDSDDELRALAAARRRNVPVAAARAGSAYRLGRLTLRVLWPADPGNPGDEPNDHAVVLLASYGSVDALLTADAESNVTLPLRPPPVEILKVAHHGSEDPGLAALLQRLRPQVAVISVGERNDYGHPRAETLAALRASPGLVVYRTDRDGRVVLESDGKDIWVRGLG